MNDSNYKRRLEEVKKFLDANDAKLISHYYVDSEIQRLTEDTGGCVADSLQMAKFGTEQTEKNLIIAGVRFMGETAKILNPEKKIYVLDKDATCSLDDSCGVDDFKNFCDKYPERDIVVYANDQTGVDMIMLDGACIVHEEYKTIELKKLIRELGDCEVLVHPESPRSIIQLADVVGSTTKLINASKISKSKNIIVATEKGIFYQMKKLSPEKNFFEAPTEGEGATCKSCGRCPWMHLNTFDKLMNVINQNNEIHLDEKTVAHAKKSINRMIEFEDKYYQKNKRAS